MKRLGLLEPDPEDAERWTIHIPIQPPGGLVRERRKPEPEPSEPIAALEVGPDASLLEIYDEEGHFWTCERCRMHQYGGLRIRWDSDALCERCLREYAAADPEKLLLEWKSWAADQGDKFKRERPFSPLWRIAARREEARELRATRKEIDEYRAWLEQPDRATLLAREIEGLREAVSVIDERFAPEDERRVFAMT